MLRLKNYCIIICLLFGLSFCATAIEIFDDFSTDSGLWEYVKVGVNIDTGEHYAGSAYRDPLNKNLVLTRPINYQVGLVWLKQDIYFPFVAEFKYRAGGGSGADGLVFMFYKKKHYLPYDGGALGFVASGGGPQNPVPVPGYGIEFDNWQNYEYNDLSANHISLIKDHIGNHLLSVNSPETEDDRWHHVKVDVRVSSIVVYLDGKQIMRWDGNIIRQFGGIGFAASTGAWNNWHVIDDVRIKIPQGTVRGRVTDSSTGRGIGQATLLVEPNPLPFNPTTNDDGYFSFALPPGVYTITAKAQGYRSQSKANVYVQDEREVLIDFTLPSGFWAQLNLTSTARWSLRSAPNLKSSVLKELPNHWVVWVVNDYNNAIKSDDYIWWQVEDTTDGLRGWMAAKHSRTNSQYLIGSPHDQVQQAELEMKADPVYADTKGERINIIKEAVLHYFNNKDTYPSLYSSDDLAITGAANKLSDLKSNEFPIKVIFALIVQESGGTGYTNIDGGVMQVTWSGSRGAASNIKCYSNDARYYGNTRQAIFANIKDGLKVLRDFYMSVLGQTNAYALAVWKYNGGYSPKITYCRCQGDPFYLAHVAIRLSGDDLLEGKPVCRGQVFYCSYCYSDKCEKIPMPCSYITSPTISDFNEPLDSSLAEPLKRFQRDHVTAAICSDAVVLIRDSLGRMTGVVNGEIKEEIPGSAYVENVAAVFCPLENYEYDVIGKRNGFYSLIIERVTEHGTLMFTAVEIPVCLNALHRFYIDWDALARGEKAVTVLIDQNGDRVFERVLQTGSELRGEDVAETKIDKVIAHGPEPVTSEGCVFWLNLPTDAINATLKIFAVDGTLIVSVVLDPNVSRFPPVGRWKPVDAHGRLLGSGLYLYLVEIKHSDGRVTYSPIQKMVILR